MKIKYTQNQENMIRFKDCKSSLILNSFTNEKKSSIDMQKKILEIKWFNKYLNSMNDIITEKIINTLKTIFKYLVLKLDLKFFKELKLNTKLINLKINPQNMIKYIKKFNSKLKSLTKPNEKSLSKPNI